MGVQTKRSGVELLKESSRGLRGELGQELAEGGTQVSEDAYNLLKFHGTYEQYDRDTATELKQLGEEKAYSFMVRVRMPGGRLTAAQYLVLDRLSDTYGNATLRITTRQGIQFHGVLKADLKPAIAAINNTLLTTQAACGDVVRNVVTTPAPVRDAVHARLEADARMLSEKLLPKSRAYHQIFLDEPDREDAGTEAEPLYGPTFLPRKFKIAIATPQDNTPDVMANDLGVLAIFEGQALVGYNIAIGGGLGMTHNRKDTYPRLASMIGSVGPDELLAATEGLNPVEAAIGAAKLRLRPILMTSLAFMAGVMPLAISSGAGAGSANDIGTGVVGGMFSATILAIFIVPLGYVLVRRAFPGRSARLPVPEPGTKRASKPKADVLVKEDL